MELDAEQQTLARVDGRGNRSTMTYDSRGRMVESIEAAGTAVAARAFVEYDANSNRTRVLHPRHFTEATPFITTYEYTGRNLLKSTTEAFGTPDAATMSQTYLLDGRIENTTDGRGNVWSQRWKQCCGRLAAKIDPLLADGTQPATYFAYDFYGNVTQTVRLRDIAGLATCCAPDLADADTLSETTAKYDARHRKIAETVWLDPLGTVDENDPPILRRRRRARRKNGPDHALALRRKPR